MPGARQFWAMKPSFSSDRQITSSPPRAPAAAAEAELSSSTSSDEAEVDETWCQLQPGMCNSCSCIANKQVSQIKYNVNFVYSN